MSYGIDKVFNFFVEAGVGFAEDSLRLIDKEKEEEIALQKTADLSK